MILRLSGGLGVRTVVLGELQTNCYVLSHEASPRECWVVDPGLSAQPLVDLLRERQFSVRRILLTHGHADHIAGVAAVKQAWPEAVLTCPAGDAEMLSDPMRNLSLPFGFRIVAPAPEAVVAPGQRLEMGPLTWEVLDSSGHTPGGASYYCAESQVLLSGDALFAGSVGRTDIPGADEALLLKNIRANLLSLPQATRVLPGHGPPTTIGRERRENPFVSP